MSPAIAPGGGGGVGSGVRCIEEGAGPTGGGGGGVASPRATKALASPAAAMVAMAAVASANVVGGGEAASMVLAGPVCGGKEGHRVALASDLAVPGGGSGGMAGFSSRRGARVSLTGSSMVGRGAEWEVGARVPPSVAAGRSSGSPLHESPRLSAISLPTYVNMQQCMLIRP